MPFILLSLAEVAEYYYFVILVLMLHHACNL